MYQLAHRSTNNLNLTNGDLSNGPTPGQAIRVVLLLANTFDCESLQAMLSRHQRIDVLAATADIDFGLARCQRLAPQILILDPKVAADAIQRAALLVRSRQAQHLLVLDDRLYEWRLTSLLAMPAVSYLTRQAGFDVLLASTLQIANGGGRMFDPLVQQRLSHTRHGLRLEQPSDRPSVALLTSRETQVMKLLTGGYSVRRCAEQLELAESTIDNHKSRLMKKLEIHKIVELTHFAIREGLIMV